MASITVRYFAAAADAAGTEQESLELEAPTLDALRTWLADRYGSEMQRVLRSGSFLVDGTVRCDGGAIAGAEVDVLPAFAGG